jgi:hypothetical protein
LLWLLPLLAVFAAPGRWLGFALAPATAWLVFTGTVALAYLFFIRWRVVPAGQWAEFAPLYVLLVLSGLAPLRAALTRHMRRASARQSALRNVEPVA